VRNDKSDVRRPPDAVGRRRSKAAITYLTVGLSALLRGLSAAPLVNSYVKWFQAASSPTQPAMESTRADEHRSPLPGTPRAARV